MYQIQYESEVDNMDSTLTDAKLQQEKGLNPFKYYSQTTTTTHKEVVQPTWQSCQKCNIATFATFNIGA